jgi:hypothetical protein
MFKLLLLPFFKGERGEGGTKLAMGERKGKKDE